MIKFFRNIRQRLLTENKHNKSESSNRSNGYLSGRAGRYLIYAFGEIILVVVGILLALQVNNWNIDRKNDQKLADLSANILNELLQVRNLIENRIEGINNQKNLTYYLINNSKIEMDSVMSRSKSGQLQIDVLNFLFSFKFHLNPRMDNYSSAVNDGSLNLFESKELKSYLNTAFTMSSKRVSDHSIAENEVNILLNEYVSNEYQELFVLGDLQNNNGGWDESTTFRLLEKINTDGKLRYLFSAKLQILQFKHGDLKFRILPVIDNAIALIEDKKY